MKPLVSSLLLLLALFQLSEGCEQGTQRDNGRFYETCECDYYTECSFVLSGCYIQDYINGESDNRLAIGEIRDTPMDLFGNGFRLTCEHTGRKLRLSVQGCFYNGTYIELGYHHTVGAIQVQCTVQESEVTLLMLTRDSEANAKELVQEPYLARVVMGNRNDSDTSVAYDDEEASGNTLDEETAVAPSETTFDLATLSHGYACGELFPGQMYQEGSFYGACVCRTRHYCEKKILGCFAPFESEENQKVAVGSLIDYTFHGDFGIKKQCLRTGINMFSFNAIECYFGNDTMNAGDYKQFGNFWVVCLNNQHGIKIQTKGIMPVSLHNKTFTYNRNCTKDATTTITRNGENYYSKCECENNFCADKIIACQDSFTGQRVELGESVNRLIGKVEKRLVGYTYECRRDCKGHVEFVPTECFVGSERLARGGRRRVGRREVWCQDRNPALALWTDQ